jgi:hypothetical protein
VAELRETTALGLGLLVLLLGAHTVGSWRHGRG